MRCLSLRLVGWALFGMAAALCAVEPIPESQQAALALKLIDAYHGPRPASPPKVLHVVYFTPSDRAPEPRYRERLEGVLEDIRAFYRDGMVRAGFGPKTFNLARDAEGKWIVHLVQGREPEDRYPTAEGDKVTRECRPMLEAAGISLKEETVVIFCNLAVWDEKAKTFRYRSPYAGSWNQTGGLCWAADCVIDDVENIPKKEPILNDGQYGNMPLGKHATIFIGGIAHELGHAFALPHCGERWDEKPLGTSLMGAGNHTYRNERRGDGKGSFLAMASAMKLAARPLFNGSDRGLSEPPRLEQSDLLLSTNVSRRDLAGRPATLRVEGTVRGTPPVYGVIAYFDSKRDGGYHAPAATAVPDADGRFALEVSDLAPCDAGELRIEYCHVNGAVSQDRASFGVTRDRKTDLSEWETRQALRPLAKAVAGHDVSTARAVLAGLEKGNAPKLARTIARKLAATLSDEPKPSPADVPAQTVELSLGDARPQSAKVGWLKPAANRVPTSDQMDSPLLDCGRLYATGLYAHAPARHVFDLGGRWKTLRGEAGLHTAQQPYGSVAFIIKTDGREVFHSAVIRGPAKASYNLDVAGVKTLELIVDEADNQNFNDWALWLDPILTR